jgi:Uma2 family endonuclease
MNLISKPPAVPLLENGEKLTQTEFHRRYAVYPGDVKFELIGGTVYMASPLRRPHAVYGEELSFAFGVYRRATPGVELLPNATAILGKKSEPQPDLALRILPDFGGRTEDTEDEYVKGPPELLAEIAYSTRAIDLHLKKEDYQRARVLEYLVVSLEEKQLYWFRFPSGTALKPDRQGIYRSRVFPGLWIDGQALLARDSARIMEVVQRGLAHPSHAAFVKRLQAARRRKA